MPVKYIIVKVRIADEQKAKIRNALHSGSDCINLRLKAEDLTVEDLLALKQTQVNRLQKALEQNKSATIRMSKTKIKHNLKITGGFLPLLAGLSAKAVLIVMGTVLPALATGALSGVASTGTSKLLVAGLYLKKRKRAYKMVPQGEVLYLKPHRGTGLSSFGDGLYIKSGMRFIDGRGLLLGQNNPISNVLKTYPYSSNTWNNFVNIIKMESQQANMFRLQHISEIRKKQRRKKEMN